ILLQKAAKLILKCFFPMVRFLIEYVSLHLLNMRLTYRKCPVAILPVKLSQIRCLTLCPLRGRAFDRPNNAGDRMVFRQHKKQMHMIRNAAYEKCWTVIGLKSFRQISMHVVAYGFVRQKRKSIFS